MTHEPRPRGLRQRPAAPSWCPSEWRAEAVLARGRHADLRRRGRRASVTRAALFFDWSRITGPILVLAGWAAFGTALVIALGGRVVDIVEAETEAAAGAAV
jgi:hypothetical protein